VNSLSQAPSGPSRTPDHHARDGQESAGHADKNHAARSAALSEGHDFSRADNRCAEGASSEGSQGNPLRVPPTPCLSASAPEAHPPGADPPPASSLEGIWLEIFRAGDYGERGRWSADDLDRLAAGYNPRLQPAPVVLGHPADDAPAFGWIKRLRRAGQSLWAQLEKVDPVLESLLRAGRFRQRSVSLYRHFPATGGPYLRHLGFLGAAAPSVKGLAPVRFAEQPSVTIEFAGECPAPHRSPSSEDNMPDKSTLENFLDHLRAFFTTGDSTPAGSGDVAAPADSSSAFAERIAQLEQRLDTLAAEKTAAEEKLTDAESAHCREQIANFVESLRRRGRFPPAFDRWGVREFMERLAALDPGNDGRTDIPVCPSPSGEFPSGDEAAPADSSPEVGAETTRPSPLAWFQDFLSNLPAVIEFGRLGELPSPAPQATGRGGRLVSFTEPQRGMTIDPASIELAERAEALAAARGISYAEALAQLREEHRATPATA
jgi:hypothetical protein